MTDKADKADRLNMSETALEGRMASWAHRHDAIQAGDYDAALKRALDERGLVSDGPAGAVWRKDGVLTWSASLGVEVEGS